MSHGLAYSKRPARGIASDWINRSYQPRLEPRFMASIVLTRVPGSTIGSTISDPQPHPGEPFFNSGPQVSQASDQRNFVANNNGNVDNAIGQTETIAASITHAVIDNPGGDLQTIDLLVAHTDQGQLSAYAGPAANVGGATYNTSTFTNGGGLAWAVTNSDGSPLPNTLSVDVDFRALYMASNPDNSAQANLTFRSTFINVNINGDGLVASDPNRTDPGITLPPFVANPGGTVIYYDPSFSTTPSGNIDVSFRTTVTTEGGAFGFGVAYVSNMGGPQLAASPPGTPDLTRYQDTFN